MAEGKKLIGQKASALLSGSTTGVGIATFFQVVPEILGALASVAGITLSVVVICDRVKKGALERKHIRLENAILKRKLIDQARVRKK